MSFLKGNVVSEIFFVLLTYLERIQYEVYGGSSHLSKLWVCWLLQFNKVVIYHKILLNRYCDREEYYKDASTIGRFSRLDKATPAIFLLARGKFCYF